MPQSQITCDLPRSVQRNRVLGAFEVNPAIQQKEVRSRRERYRIEGLVTTVKRKIPWIN